MEKNVNLNSAARDDSSSIDGIIGTNHKSKLTRKIHRNLRLYDSFVRNIQTKGYGLVFEKNKFYIAKFDNIHTPECSCDKLIEHQRPIFWWDFCEGSFQERLKKFLGYRAASPIYSLSVDQEDHDIKNRDGKIILRVSISKITFPDASQKNFVSAHPLLGYEDESRKLIKKLIQGLSNEENEEALGLQVERFLLPDEQIIFPKRTIELSGEQNVHSAVAKICHVMIRAARQNEPGIIDDIDTEFLHSYRVSLRKLRSILSLIKGAFTADVTKELKDEFGELAKKTNQLRDLDVYLLEEEALKSILPESTRPGLDRMFSDFKSERKKALSQIRRHLKSKKYQEKISRYQQLFCKGDLGYGKRGEHTIGAIIELELKRHLKKVKKLGYKIERDTPNEEIHELRIECKKLRYLLESFNSILPKKSLEYVVRKLRKLQNVLGDFNDFSVQINSLETYLDENKDLEPETISAVGGLILNMYQKHNEARGLVKERFLQFCDEFTTMEFDTLLNFREKVSQ